MAARRSGERSSVGKETAWKVPPSDASSPRAKVRTPQMRQKTNARCGSASPVGVQRYSEMPEPASRRNRFAPLANANQARTFAQYEQLQRFEPSSRLADDACDLDAPRLDVDDEKNEEADQANEREHLGGEEVRRRDRAQMRLQESGPGHPAATRVRGFETVLAEDTLDRVSGEDVSKVAQGVTDARVAPTRVLCGEPDDELSKRHWRRLTQPANVMSRNCSGAALMLSYDTVKEAGKQRSDRPTPRRVRRCKAPRSLTVRVDRISAPDGIGTGGGIASGAWFESPTAQDERPGSAARKTVNHAW